MVRPKLKVKTKAGRNKKPKLTSRWAKGQSCLSNPESTKFRDQASAHYFHQVTRNPLLTVDNVGANARSRGHDSDSDDVLSEDVQSLSISDRGSSVGSFASYKTFASDWSRCSNRAFERFLSKFKLDSALHKEMLSILAATTEVINSLGGTHKETEYFASFITTLDKCEPQQYQAMMALLAIIAGKVPDSVLRKTFPQIYPRIGSILAHALDTFDTNLTRVCCDVLRKILGVQDTFHTQLDEEIQRIFYSMLRCAIHENAKVRKKARQAIGTIMTRQAEQESSTVSKLVIGWILDQLATFPTCGTKAAGDSIGLLHFVWQNVVSISVTGSKKLYESVLRVMSSGDMAIIKIGFTFFSTVFTKAIRIKRETESDSSSSSFTPKLIAALWDFRPDWRNGEAFISWLRCILDGLVRLAEEGSDLASSYVPRVIEVISETWPSSFGPVASKVVTEYLLHIMNEDVPLESTDACFQVLSKNLISIPPNENCLKVLSALLDTLSPAQFTPGAREVLLQLVPLKTEQIIGRFIRAFKLETLWSAVDVGTRHTVILPLVRENLSGAKILHWTQDIKPLLQSGKEALILLVWDSLVGFCRDPVDPANFPAEFVGKTIVEKPRVRLMALAALRQFGMWSQCRMTMRKFSKNFLPLLFNLYVQEKGAALKLKAKKKKRVNEEEEKEEVGDENMGHSDAIGTTIQEYIQHTDLEFLNDLIDRALNKIKSEETPAEEKGPILDLLGFLSAGEISREVAERVLETASCFTVDEDHMKRSYRIITSLIKNKFVSLEIKQKIAEVLQASKGKTKSNAQALRLEGILSLVLQNQRLMPDFLPEVILNLLSVNMRARKVSVQFVSNLCDQHKFYVHDAPNFMESISGVVQLGLNSSSSFVTACTIHFLRLVYTELLPTQINDGLIQSCLDHMQRTKDVSISREALAFLSLNLSLYRSSMGPYAATLGKILAQPGLPRKEVNKMLGRMIRVFGVPGLKAVLPNSDDPKVASRIKNLQKKLRKLKESKNKKDEYDGEDRGRDRNDEESDEEESGEERAHQSSKPSKGIHRLIIKEDVVDFLDPKNMTASLINMPKPVKKDEEFEFNADGKLIITDGKKKDKSANEDDDDEDMESEFFQTPQLPGSRKRKHGGGTSVASSKRSMKSYQSGKSGKSSSSKMSKHSKHSRKGAEPDRVRLQAKRRKTKSSSGSVKSSRTDKSHGRKSKKESFNYKK